jgi:hypothetical protein
MAKISGLVWAEFSHEQLVSWQFSMGKSDRLLGKTGIIPGTRELIPHESYRLVYEIEQETVWILAIVHTARMWPPMSAYK